MRHSIEEYRRYVKEEIELAIQRGFEYLHEDYKDISGDVAPLTEALIRTYTDKLTLACADAFREQLKTLHDTNVCARWVQCGNDSVTFVICTNDDYWTWQISKGDWENYFGGQMPLTYEHIQDFINNPDTSDKGCSESGFCSVSEALASL